MVNDPESQLYRDMADIKELVPELQKEIKSLKGKITKLTNRIQTLEMMAFQEQITSLVEKINLLNEKALETSRYAAKFEMDFIQYHMKGMIHQKLSNQERERLSEHITQLFATAKERVQNSLEPISILIDFKNECIDCSKKYDLDAFG
jgi:hypothetical protein